jgi:predicted nuclease of predicted toxin-antitoxin system
VRFLIDTCAGRRLAEWLRAEGHDVVRVTDAGPDPGDAAVLARSVAEKRVLVTMDKDFGALIHRERLVHAGVIRLPHSTAAERIAMVRELLRRHPASELHGAIVTVRGTRIRIVGGPNVP